MSNTPISKNQQVYTDRYGNQPTRTEGNPRPEADYDTFDVPGIEGFDTLGGMEGMEFDDISQGQVGEGLGDQDLINGMSEEEYIAHYRNNVAPQNRQEAEALMAEVGGEGDSTFNAKKTLEELKATLNKPETIATLDEEVRDELLGKLSELTTLAGRRGVNPEELQDKVEEFREELQGAIEEAKGPRQEKIAAMKEEIKSLETRIEESRISADDKSALTDRLTDLNDDLKKSGVNLETAQSTLDDIKKALKDTKLDWPLDEVVAHIPTSNDWSKYDHAKGIAQEIDAAFANDDWQTVTDHLNINIGWHAELPADQGERNRKIMNDVIRKVVTGIYEAAGSMDECMELLKMIPADVRQRMADLVAAEGGELTEKGAGDKWTSGGTQSILLQSLQESPTTPTEPAPS